MVDIQTLDDLKSQNLKDNFVKKRNFFLKPFRLLLLFVVASKLLGTDVYSRIESGFGPTLPSAISVMFKYGELKKFKCKIIMIVNNNSFIKFFCCQIKR